MPRPLRLPSLFVAAMVLLIVAPAPGPFTAPAALPDGVAVASPPSAETTARIEQAFGQLPLYFVENQGQMDQRVAYYVQGSDKMLYFSSDGVTFALTAPLTDTLTPTLSLWEREFRSLVTVGFPSPAGGRGDGVRATQRWTVKLDFLGANHDARPVGLDKTEAVISYFKGPKEEWHAGLPTYSRIVYPDLWPGIDLVYYGTVNRLKYEFIVHPGADPTQIRLAYRGATEVALNAAGQLEVTTPAGGFSDDTPVAYQEIGGQRVPVAVAYALHDNAQPETQNSQLATRNWPYGFRVGAYDPARPLVLDPAVIVYCGYIGGGSSDDSNGIAVDGAGNAYVTGATLSSEAAFPVTVGPDLTYNGNVDAFVAKVKADGTGLAYCGYIGGTRNDRSRGIAVDGAGNAYVTGYTESGEDTFPVTVGPDLTYNGSYYDAFVAKIKADGAGLAYCGYIGGVSDDFGYAIAVGRTGNAYVTGETWSTEASFPVTIGPDLTFNGYYDAFVAKVKSDGTSLVYCGYIGGVNLDVGAGIAVDSPGNVYVTGWTESEEDTFPVTVGPDLTYNGGYHTNSRDAFVAKVKANGTGLDYCGYIGGDQTDTSYGIAVDGSGNAYVTGFAVSTEATFPVIVGPDLTYNGSTDAFVAKVKADGTGLAYCGYIGGSGYDCGTSIAVDGTGNTYVTGWTQSSEATFPVTVGPDLTYNDGYADNSGDAFVAKAKADVTGLAYCGYIGGARDDAGHGIAVDGTGKAYVTGYTRSTEATFPIAVGPDLTYNGDDGDAFVAKVSGEGGPGPETYSISGRITANSGNPISGVTISAGAGGSATTDASGDYTITGLIAGTYTLTPAKAGYTFSPPSRTVSVPPDATGQDFAGIAVPPKWKLLFVPLGWQDTQVAFDAEAQTQAGLFVDEVPLGGCRNQVSVETLNVTTQNYGDFTCSATDCAVETVRSFAKDVLKVDPADYDVIVGLAEASPCAPIAGCSNGTDTIWVTEQYDTVTAHELGHIYGLVDQYCSNQAGSADPRCNDGDIQGDGATTGDVNWLDASLPCDCPPNGANDSGGSPCCNFGGLDCSIVNYGVCCQGNKNSAGGRSTMSYANAAEPRGFDVHDKAHLDALPELACGSLSNAPSVAFGWPLQDASQTVLDVNLLVHQDDAVDKTSISITQGRRTPNSVLQGMSGGYVLEIVDANGGMLWSQAFELYFDYTGPVVLGVDYSGVSYDLADLSLRIPYTCEMSVLELYHGSELIFSAGLPAGCRFYLPSVLKGR